MADDDTTARVLAAARDLIARGVIPSEARLHRELPDVGTTTIRRLRASLRASGLIAWSGVRRWCTDPGCWGATEEERRHIERTRARILARKRRQGEPPPRRARPAVPRVYHVPRWTQIEE